TIPAGDEINQAHDMLVRRCGVAIERHRDIIHIQDKMVLARDAIFELRLFGAAQACDDMARASPVDGFMKARKRADVDHGRFQYEEACVISMTRGAYWKALMPRQFGEALKKSCFRGIGGPGHQVVAFER